jgi:hypothetical protein
MWCNRTTTHSQTNCVPWFPTFGNQLITLRLLHQLPLLTKQRVTLWLLAALAVLPNKYLLSCCLLHQVPPLPTGTVTLLLLVAPVAPAAAGVPPYVC